jgi:hypothetical protein
VNGRIPHYIGSPGQLVRGLPGSINPATDQVMHFDGSLQSTRGTRPEAGHDAELLASMGLFGGAVRVASSLGYNLPPLERWTIVLWRDERTWSEYQDLTWEELEAL